MLRLPVNAKLVPGSPILVALMMEAIRSPKRWFLQEPQGVLRLLVTANLVPDSPILVALMMEAIRSSETSVLTRATRRASVASYC
jgi:hypothetical protein